MGRKQDVRLSNFVLQYGPGAVIETPGGPRIICSAEIGLFAQGVDPGSLEVNVPFLGTPVSHDRAAFLVPSEALWKTRPFPTWKLCTDHWILYHRTCPKCTQGGRGGSRQQAIRFVMACPNGHLDEVDWPALVHGGQRPSDNTHRDKEPYFIWETRGPRLSQTLIKCPFCGASASLSKGYYEDWPCTGRFPEKEKEASKPERPRDCQEKMRMIQRQAINLRVPEVLSFLTIPPLESRELGLLRLEIDDLKRGLRYAGLLDDSGNGPALRVTRKGTIPAPTVSEAENLRRCFKVFLEEIRERRREQDIESLRDFLERPEELALAIERVLDYRPPGSMEEALLREFEALLQGADRGIPPARQPIGPGAWRTLIEMNPSMVRRDVPGPSGTRLIVAPVERLHVVTVQVGYRRIVGSAVGSSGLQGRLVDVGAPWISRGRGTGGEKKWYPAYSSMGEGLFFALDTENGPGVPQTDRWEKWRSIYRKVLGEGKDPRDPDVYRLHPTFVWWHTLSHLVLRALAVDSGYNLASIGERVYLDFKALSEGNDDLRGGILLYTTSPGADGTLGGLVAMTDRIDRLIGRALEEAVVCSSDPLCWENPFDAGSPLGAACYACLLVSETSCRHRNLWLDRRILL